MEIIYKGVDITSSIQPHNVIIKDESEGRCDSAEIVLENATAWYRWMPQTGDDVVIREGNYSTGKLFLDTMRPEDGRYKLILTGLNAGARTKRSTAYMNNTLYELANSCAAECGMKAEFYGVDSSVKYGCIIRDEETAPAFLEKIAKREGAVLKVFGGKMVLIGIESCQDKAATQTITLDAVSTRLTHMMRSPEKARSIKVISHRPGIWADVYAIDSAADGKTITADFTAENAAQAGRWARGTLLAINRQAETIDMATELNTGITAMTRIDTISDVAALNGEWLIRRCEHSLTGRMTMMQMVRCIRTIQ